MERSLEVRLLRGDPAQVVASARLAGERGRVGAENLVVRLPRHRECLALDGDLFREGLQLRLARGGEVAARRRVPAEEEIEQPAGEDDEPLSHAPQVRIED